MRYVDFICTMTKKKRPFINKKTAISFQLADRSQHDPLIVDETAPTKVLVPVTDCGSGDSLTPEQRRAEQRKFGIYFDDDYDYLRHLKSGFATKSAVGEFMPPIETIAAAQSQDNRPTIFDLVGESERPSKPIMLPSSMFETEIQSETALLTKSLEKKLRLDWDPDVIAALDSPDEFDYDNENNQLEDDFVTLAQGDQSNADGDQSDCDVPGAIDNLSAASDDGSAGSDGFGECDASSELGTNYSMTSSVIRRNDALRLLDDQFDSVLKSYEATDIGSLDTETLDVNTINENDPYFMQLLAEFEQKSRTRQRKRGRSELAAVAEAKNDDEDAELSEDSADQERPSDDPDRPASPSSDSDAPLDAWFQEAMTRRSKHATDQPDCQSILSSYSTHLNHPQRLHLAQLVSKRSRNTSRSSGDTDVPGDGLTGLTLQEVRKQAAAGRTTQPLVRPPGETSDERRSRKHVTKELRRERRQEKKQNKLAFRDEKIKQQRQIVSDQQSGRKGIVVS